MTSKRFSTKPNISAFRALSPYRTPNNETSIPFCVCLRLMEFSCSLYNKPVVVVVVVVLGLAFDTTILTDWPGVFYTLLFFLFLF